MAEFTLKNFQKKPFPFQLTSTVHHDDQAFYLVFKIQGDLGSINLGEYHPKKERVLKLWEKTCFEFFIKDQNSNQYLEFNFSPNFSWNAFYFQDYRSELREWEEIHSIEIDILNSLDHFTLMAKIPYKNIIQKLNSLNNLSYSTTAVLLEKDQSKSYWAIDHLDQVPNFHYFESIKYKF